MKNKMSMGLGIPTILMVFVIMAMMILTLLTYLNAKQNVESVRKEKENAIAYYEADCEAQYLLHHKQALTQYKSYKENSDGYEFTIDMNNSLYLKVKVQNQEIINYQVERK